MNKTQSGESNRACWKVFTGAVPRNVTQNAKLDERDFAFTVILKLNASARIGCEVQIKRREMMCDDRIRIRIRI